MVTCSKVAVADNLHFSRIVPGLMRLNEWNMSNSDLIDWIIANVEMGVTTFDHADIYGGHTCEEIFGHALGKLGASVREQIQLISKCGIAYPSPNRSQFSVKHYDTSADYIIQSAENSLKMLQTDYLDVLLIHRPDPLMNADEIAEAFSRLRNSGKVRHFGVSNFTPYQLSLIASHLDFPLVTNQVEISVSQMNALHDGTLDQCQRFNMIPMAWSPLGGGRIFHHKDEQSQRVYDALVHVSEEHENAAIDQIAIAWLLRHPANIVPVLGTGKIDRIRSAVEAESVYLNREQWFTIWTASAGHRVP